MAADEGCVSNRAAVRARSEYAHKRDAGALARDAVQKRVAGPRLRRVRFARLRRREPLGLAVERPPPHGVVSAAIRLKRNGSIGDPDRKPVVSSSRRAAACRSRRTARTSRRSPASRRRTRRRSVCRRETRSGARRVRQGGAAAGSPRADPSGRCPAARIARRRADRGCRRESRCRTG